LIPTRLISLCLLLACAASAQQPARAPEYESVFDDKRVHSIHFVVEGGDWDKISQKPFEWFQGEVEIDGERVANVGIREKGNSSAGIRSEKKPFKIGFAKYDKEQRYKGLRTLVLNNGFKDPTLLREKLAYDLHRAIGLPASRAAFAVVTATAKGSFEKKQLGLYTIVEHVDETFLDERFGGHAGNLYKIEGMQDLFARVDEVRIADEKCVELKTNEKENDRSRLVRLAAAIADGKSDLTKWLDCDGFAKWLAATSALVNLDSYAGTGHNFYLYDDPKSGKFVLIPWDLNEAFGNFQMGPADDHLAWDIHAPWAGSKKLIERFVAVPALKAKYLQALRDLCAKDFAPKPMALRIDVLARLIRDAAAEDTLKQFPTVDWTKNLTQDIGGGQRGPMNSKIFGLRPFVERRVDSILKQLAGKAQGEKLEGGPGPGGGPPGGGPGGKPPGPPPDKPPK
jgi:hypothetical protein